MQARDYQLKGLRSVTEAYAKGAQSVLMVLPTGGGKTIMFGQLAANTSERTLIVVHRRELALQAAARLRSLNADFGFEVAGMPRKPSAKIQIGTVQSLVRRDAPPADFVIFDEAHLSTADTWQQVRDRYPKARFLGVTATPWRLSGKPLVQAYDASVVVATPEELRSQGFLCGYQGFSYNTPDLTEVKTTAGDYNEKQAASAMRAPGLVGNVVEMWLQHASHLSTVVFNVTVEHSKEVTAKFREAGVKAEHLDGTTSLEEREAILARVNAGITQVLCNVGVAVEGLDIPRLKCCVLNRPTMSMSRAIQMMGRVRRPWNGVDARIHDHAFVIAQHGLPDMERDYSLVTTGREPGSSGGGPRLFKCPKCFAITVTPGECTACGFQREVKARGVNYVDDAVMFEFSALEAPKSEDAELEAKVREVLAGVEYKISSAELRGKLGISSSLFSLRTAIRDAGFTPTGQNAYVRVDAEDTTASKIRAVLQKVEYEIDYAELRKRVKVPLIGQNPVSRIASELGFKKVAKKRGGSIWRRVIDPLGEKICSELLAVKVEIGTKELNFRLGLESGTASRRIRPFARKMGFEYKESGHKGLWRRIKPGDPLSRTSIIWKNPRTIEGKRIETRDEPTAWGGRKFYVIRGAEREYEFPGTTQLDKLMAKVPDDAQIRLTYVGETPLNGGRARKDFKLEVDE